jgi:hypothetical protein
MSMKSEMTQLKRENTRLAKAVVKQKAGIDARQKLIDASSDWEKRWSDVRNDLSSVTRSKNDLVESKASLERTVSAQAQEIINFEALLKDIQRDMTTGCELMYGQDFDPSNIERLMPMMSAGVEYVPRLQTEGASGYVEPAQRLIRMIWRRTHWGLNPLMERAYVERLR